ncbi:MAG: flagellar motor protein MotB [Alphaproteobacteria bacterium]
MEAGHNQPIIINKKVKKGGDHGHHGGAWKVAYADFVTAMMAFFLLLWLLSTTTVEQRSGIADYFTPTTSLRSGESGAGGILGGQTLSDSGAKIGEGGTPSVVVELTPPGSRDAKEKDIEELAAKREQESFEDALQALNKAITDSPELSDLKDNIQVDMTSEGMRIQIVDREGGALFRAGSADMNARTRDLIGQIAKVVAALPNDISISGHTDSNPFSRGDYSNWELSSDRANASRRQLVSSGIDPTRIVQVVGKADQEPLVEEDPFLPENRRVSIVLRRTSAVLPPGLFN